MNRVLVSITFYKVRNPICLRGLMVSLCILILSSCSSVFYQPSREELIDRKKLTLQPQDVYFTSEDGVKLHGWYFKSPKFPKPKGVILFFHGNAQNLTTHFFSIYHAPDMGYEYFIFDYRGYGESEGSPTPKGTVMDGRAALRWIKHQNPNLPLFVFGQSLGGAVAMRTVLDLKAEIPVDLVIVDSTFASYRSAACSVLSNSWLTWIFQPIGWLIVDNSQGVKSDLKKLSPIPLVVIHGEEDPVVNFSLGEDVFAAAVEPKEFWKIPHGRHIDFMWRENGAYSDRFFQTLDARVKDLDGR